MLRLTLYGGFSLARAGGEELAVTSRKARGLLAYLALSPGMRRSREQIMALLWSDRGEAQARGSLRQVLTRLRKELGDAADVLVVDNESVALNPALIMVAPPDGHELLAGLHLNDEAFEEWLRDERAGQGHPVTRPAMAAEKAGRSEVAVLPFDNMTGDPGQDAFCDGLTEDMIAELTRFSDFTVYSPWSSFAHDPDKTTEDVVRELEVDYVLEGSVRRAGNRVRITVMLFDAETVNHVWVQRYDRELKDIFAVQDEVARDVATTVSILIEIDDYDAATERPAGALSAHERVLLGECALHYDWKERSAVAQFEAALALDPDCARAYANLANWHASSPITDFVPFDVAQARVRDCGERALDLEPDDAISLAVLADAYALIGDMDLARQCIEAAIRQNPNHHSVMIFAAGALAWMGELKQAQTWLARYQRFEPLWTSAAMEVALVVHYLSGAYDAAVAAIARWRNPPHYMMALSAAAHAQAGQMDEAARLREMYLDGLPEGQTLNTHLIGPIGDAMKPELAGRWLDGLAKAGFRW